MPKNISNICVEIKYNSRLTRDRFIFKRKDGNWILINNEILVWRFSSITSVLDYDVLYYDEKNHNYTTTPFPCNWEIIWDIWSSDKEDVI